MPFIVVEGNKVGLSEELLTHSELSRIQVRSDMSNAEAFIDDFKKNDLDCWKGRYVAYQKTVPCCIGKEKEQLYRAAKGYYGSSSLAVFLIPQDESGLAASVKEAKGWLNDRYF